MPSGSTWNAWRLLRGSIARVLQGPPAERGLPAARGSIRLLGSTWNSSPGLPQPGLGLSTVNGPRSLGKNSMSDDLRACGQCAGFAAAREADHGRDYGHADAPIFGSARSGCRGCVVRRDGVRPRAGGHRRPASGLQQLTAPVASAQGNAAGALPDDASANLASGSW